MDDKAIIKLMWERSEASLQALQAKYHSYCYCISIRILSDEQDAEECVNDAMLQVWNSIPPHKPENLATFIGKIIRNISINRYKEKNRQKRGGVDWDLSLDDVENYTSDDDHIDDDVLAELISEYLHSLPKMNRMVFVARYWYFEKVSDIAKNLNLSESKVKSMLLRTRNGLKKFLNEEGVIL